MELYAHWTHWTPDQRCSHFIYVAFLDSKLSLPQQETKNNNDLHQPSRSKKCGPRSHQHTKHTQSLHLRCVPYKLLESTNSHLNHACRIKNTIDPRSQVMVCAKTNCSCGMHPDELKKKNTKMQLEKVTSHGRLCLARSATWVWARAIAKAVTGWKLVSYVQSPKFLKLNSNCNLYHYLPSFTKFPAECSQKCWTIQLNL